MTCYCENRNAAKTAENNFAFTIRQVCFLSLQKGGQSGKSLATDPRADLARELTGLCTSAHVVLEMDYYETRLCT